MAAPMTQETKKIAEQGVLACRLQKKTTGRAANIPLAGELVLENVSAVDVSIEYNMSPLQYLDIVVTNADGRVPSAYSTAVSSRPWKNRASCGCGLGIPHASGRPPGHRSQGEAVAGPLSGSRHLRIQRSPGHLGPVSGRTEES